MSIQRLVANREATQCGCAYQTLKLQMLINRLFDLLEDVRTPHLPCSDLLADFSPGCFQATCKSGENFVVGATTMRTVAELVEGSPSPNQELECPHCDIRLQGNRLERQPRGELQLARRVVRGPHIFRAIR